VVKTIRKGTKGAEETIEKRELVDQEIADYFKQIYKRRIDNVRETRVVSCVSQRTITPEVSEDLVMQD
jgi:hypothetical protein